MKKKLLVLVLVLTLVLTGCNAIKSSVKDFTAETFGLSRSFYVYDDYGNQTMTVKGDSTDMQPSEVSNVILITIDGSTWQHVGSSMVAVENGIENIMDDFELDTTIEASGSGGIFTSLDRSINNFKSQFSGLQRVIVVKNQAGVIIGVYQGDSVLVEESGLPSSTKILIDGKRMTIYRCDFEIFETKMLK